MITKMHIENFKCFKNFDIDLGPFNVLIGPNDSGKTAFLEAVQVGCFGSSAGNLAERYQRDRSELFRGGNKDATVAIEFSVEGKPAPAIQQRFVRLKTQNVDFSRGKPITTGYYRFNPSSLRENTGLTNEWEWDGKNLPGILMSEGAASTDEYQKLRRYVLEKFGYEIRPTPIPNQHGQIAIRFKAGDNELPCTSVSDGVMLSVAFLALAALPKPPDILLIEEPENGVHHASLKDIVETLRAITREKGVQVIVTTHSPYLLDLAEPEEVHVFLKDSEGAVHAKKMSDSPLVQDMKKHFMTGELWTVLSEEGITDETKVKP